MTDELKNAARMCDDFAAPDMAAALRGQPVQAGEVTDEQIVDALEREFGTDLAFRNFEDDVRAARAVLALRPAAQEEWPGQSDIASHFNACQHKSYCLQLASLPTQPAAQATHEPVALTDERIDKIADIVVKGMPDGVRGFLKTWGWRQFARAILQDCAGHYAPTDATTPQQAAGGPFGQVTVRRLSQRHANHVDQYQFYPAGQPPYLDNVDECHTVYTHPAPGVPEVIDEDQIHTIERAADLLEHYAAFINEVKPDDIERHPYVPEIELTASDLRLFAAAQKGENHG